MKCNKCPLFTSWNNESDRGEACGLFGDAWDNAFQYEDKDGNIVGCYIDRHFIEKIDNGISEHYAKEAETFEQWMLETEILGEWGSE